MESKRIALWDNLKFILIFLVVLGHMVDQYAESELFQSLYVFVYAFHMPVFFFISGMFHKNEHIAQKVFTFLALGFVYKFFLFAVRSFVEEDVKLRFYSENGAPWFMFALAVFILLTYWLKDMNQGFVLIIFVLIACFAGYDNKVNSRYIMSRIIYFYPFYVLGRIAVRERLEQIARNKLLKVLAVGVLVLWFLVCIWQREHYYDFLEIFKGQKVVNEEVFQRQCFVRLECYLIAVVTGFSCIMLAPAKQIPLLTKLGRRTIQIYFWHRPILYVLFDLGWITMLCETTQGRAIYALCAIPATLILALKPFGFPTDQILWFGKDQALQIEKKKQSRREEEE